MDEIYSDELDEGENLEVAYLLANASDVEICKAADQGDAAADFIFHSIWDLERRKAAADEVDKHWKALVATDRPDGKYYEITFNGDRNEAYIDEYQKTKNTTVKI